VPTLVSGELEAMLTATERYHAARTAARGARMIGLHYEGPFLSPARHGAHHVGHLLPADDPALTALLDAAGSELAYMTLAPEIPGGMEALRRLVARGVRVAIGHSDATDDEVTAAIDAGASLVTHLYNAQRPLHHRDPGVVGAALADTRVTVGLIADLHHVAPTALRVAFAAAPGRVMLVTDAIAAMGVQPGTWSLAGRRVEVRAGRPPILEDGTIAGSSLRLDEAVANAIACGIDAASALTAATRVPADALGLHRLGRIVAGCPADLVWLDEAWRTRATWLDGVRLDVDERADDVGRQHAAR
jgi:N-acetylglucosamine-6-phosphate deacetylase